jgi:hypothetical protein
MRKLCVVIVASAALLIWAAPAVAHDRTYSTSILLEGTSQGTGPNGFTFDIAGYITSPKLQCVSGRTVKLFFVSGGTKTLIDVGTTSRNGGWDLRGSSPTKPDSYIVKFSKKVLANTALHHHVCGAAELMGTPL